MSYTVRDERGTMICKLTQGMGDYIVYSTFGSFVERGGKRVYLLDEDYSITAKDVKVFLWKQYTLIQD